MRSSRKAAWMCGIRSLSEKIIYFTITLSLYKIESVEVKIYEKKEPVLDYLIHMGNGYLLTAEALSHGISRPTIAEYVKKITWKSWQKEFIFLRMPGPMICIFFICKIVESFFHTKQLYIFMV